MTDAGERTTDPWEELLEDADAIATEYREEGWDAVVVRTKETSVVAEGDRAGVTAFVSADDYDPVEAAVEREGAAFDRADVYRRTVGGTTYALAVELDGATETVVVVPLTYSLSDDRQFLESALEEGHLPVHVRPPSFEAWVSFAHADPSLFVDAADLDG